MAQVYDVAAPTNLGDVDGINVPYPTVELNVPSLTFGATEEERDRLLLGVLDDQAIRNELAGIFYYYSNYGKRCFEHATLSLYGLEKFFDDTGLVREDLVHSATAPLLFVQVVKDSSKEELQLSTFAWILTAIALHCYSERYYEQEEIEKSNVSLEEVKSCVEELLRYVQRNGDVKVLGERYLRMDTESLLYLVERIQLTEQQKQICEHLWRRYSNKARPSVTRTTLNLRALVKLTQECDVFPRLVSRLSLKRSFLAAALPGGENGSALLMAKEEDLELPKSAFVYLLFVLALEIFDASNTEESLRISFDKLLDCIRPYIHIEAALLRQQSGTQPKPAQNLQPKKEHYKSELLDLTHQEGCINSATPSNIRIEVILDALEKPYTDGTRVLGNHSRREVTSFHEFVDRQESARHVRERVKGFTELDRVRGISPPSIPIPPPVSTHSFQIKTGSPPPFDSYTVEIKTDGDVHVSYFRDPEEAKESISGSDKGSSVEDGPRSLLGMTQNKFLKTSALNDNIIVDLW